MTCVNKSFLQNLYQFGTPGVHGTWFFVSPPPCPSCYFYLFFSWGPVSYPAFSEVCYRFPPWCRSSVGTSMWEMFTHFFVVSWFTMFENSPSRPCTPTISPCENLCSCRRIIPRVLVLVLCRNSALAFVDYSLSTFIIT